MDCSGYEPFKERIHDSLALPLKLNFSFPFFTEALCGNGDCDSMLELYHILWGLNILDSSRLQAVYIYISNNLVVEPRISLYVPTLGAV